MLRNRGVGVPMENLYVIMAYGTSTWEYDECMKIVSQLKPMTTKDICKQVQTCFNTNDKTQDSHRDIS